MKAKTLFAAAVLVLGVALVGAAQAANEAQASPAEFIAYLDEVRGELKEGKPKPLSRREQGLFDRADRDIRGILAGVESVDELDQDQSAALFNAQEQIKAILTGAEDEQVICRNESRIGSHFRERRCVSVATRREQQDAAQELLRRFPTWERTPGVN